MSAYMKWVGEKKRTESDDAVHCGMEHATVTALRAYMKTTTSDSGSHTFPETLAGQRSLTVIEALDV